VRWRFEAADRFAGCRAGNLEIADPGHVERYWRHQLLLDTAATGEAAARICRQINDARTSEAPVA
jgi:hypothetical protein